MQYLCSVLIKHFYTHMKNQIFSKLKQAYASLGLGDDFLQAQADSLAAMGLVTDENIDNVVLSQKAFLESVQKSNDKRVTDAVKKTKDASAEAEKLAKAEQAKLLAQIEELKKQVAPPAPPASNEPKKDDFQEKFNAANAPMLETLKALQEQLKSLQDKTSAQQTDLVKLQEEKAQLERAQAAAERQKKILAKAKELEIPQYRIDEGFNISDTATEEEIGTYLTTVAGNIKNNSLPQNQHFALAGKDITKADADNLANLIVGA